MDNKEILRTKLHNQVLAILMLGVAMGLLFDSALQLGGFIWLMTAFITLVVLIIVVNETTRKWWEDLYKDKLKQRREFALHYQPVGDAHWAEPGEYIDKAQIRPVEECRGTILGQLTDDASQCIDMYQSSLPNSHILAVGASGSGKTESFILPYILQNSRGGYNGMVHGYRHSLIITDPKGEIYSRLAGILEDRGYYVKRLDFINFDKSDGWDCMRYLRELPRELLETGAEGFARTIVRNIDDDTNAGTIYERGSVSLLKALVLYTILSQNLDDDQRNLLQVNSMLHQPGDAKEYFKSVFGSNDGYCEEYIEPAQTAYYEFESASENLYGNIVTHLATGLGVVKNEPIQRILTKDDIDLSLPGKKPCAYFCRFSATSSTYKFLTALFFSLLMTSLTNLADMSDKHTLDVPVDFILDEFTSIGEITDMDKIISLGRSYKLNCMMVVQNMGQLRERYGEYNAETIRSNCATVISMGINDEDGAKWLERRCGYTSVLTRSSHKDAGTNRISGGQTESIVKAPLLSSDAITSQIPRFDEIIIFQSCSPIYAHMLPTSQHPDYEKMRWKSIDDIPDITDTKKINELRSAEEERVRYYNILHPFNEPPKQELPKPINFYKMSIRDIVLLIFREDMAKIFHKKGKEEKVKTVKTTAVKKENEPTAAAPVTETVIMDDDDIFGEAPVESSPIKEEESLFEAEDHDVVEVTVYADDECIEDIAEVEPEDITESPVTLPEEDSMSSNKTNSVKSTRRTTHRNVPIKHGAGMPGIAPKDSENDDNN